MASNRGQKKMFTATLDYRNIRLADRKMKDPQRNANETRHSTNTDITQT